MLRETEPASGGHRAVWIIALCNTSVAINVVICAVTQCLGRAGVQVHDEGGGLWHFIHSGVHFYLTFLHYNCGMDTVQLLPGMTDQIVRRFAPMRIILFGSQARGEANTSSDVDLLVVLPQIKDKRQTAIEIRRALVSFSVPKDILVTTPEEISRRGNLVGTLLHTALKEGKILYERA
jgi:predicted nucleotidyltransferase